MDTVNPPIGSMAYPAGNYSQNLLLDSSIRDWVVLPLLILMIQAGLLRHYLSILLKPSGAKPIPVIEYRVKNMLARVSRMRGGGMGFIDKTKWEGRKQYWIGTGTTGSDPTNTEGYLKEELEWIDQEKEDQEIKKKVAEEAADNNNGGDMPNPMAMMDGMKGQFLFMIQNMVMMQGIGYCFQGYVLVKVPVPLTQGFKMMFQRGLDLNTLETSYVSSVSWYFLVMFGLRSFFRLVIESSGGMSKPEHQEGMMMQADFGNSLGGGPGPPGGANRFDAKKIVQAELENLELCKYKGTLDGVEQRLLRKYKQNYGGASLKKTAASAAAAGVQPGYDIYGVKASTPSSSSSGPVQRGGGGGGVKKKRSKKHV